MSQSPMEPVAPQTEPVEIAATLSAMFQRPSAVTAFQLPAAPPAAGDCQSTVGPAEIAFPPARLASVRGRTATLAAREASPETAVRSTVPSGPAAFVAPPQAAVALAGASGRRAATAPLVEPELDDRLTLARRASAMRLEEVELTPLMRAAASMSGNFVMQDLLAGGAAADETNPLGWTALMLAAAYDNVLGVFTLLQAGADVHLRDEAQQSARDKAVAAGNTWIARLLAKAETHGVAKAIAETPFPTKQLPEVVETKSLLPKKEENHSLLTSFSLKAAGRLPKLRRDPGPFMSDRIFSD